MAMSRTSGGVDMALRMGRAKEVPSTMRAKPLTRATTATVDTAWRMRVWSRWPISVEITALAPMEMPMKRLMSKPMTGALLPTAASALLPTK